MNNPIEVARDLQQIGEAAATQAFKRALVNMENVAGRMCPIGHYGATRGKSGRQGGDLQASLRVEYAGLRGGVLTAYAVSDKPYAYVQHERIFHHPGKYSGRPGPPYRAAYFERAYQVIFGSGSDPLGMVNVRIAGFEEILRAV